MFGILQSREVVAAAAIAVVMAPAYALIGSSPERTPRTDVAMHSSDAVLPEAFVIADQSGSPAAEQPRSSEFLKVSRTIRLPQKQAQFFQPAPGLQSSRTGRDFSPIPTPVVVLSQSGRAEIEAFAQALMAARQVPVPTRRPTQEKKLAARPTLSAPVETVLLDPRLPVRPSKRAAYPVLLTRHPDVQMKAESIVASRTFGPPPRYVPFPHGVIVAGASSSVVAATVSNPKAPTVATQRERATYPALLRRHPKVTSDYPIRVAALPPGNRAGMLVGITGHQARSVPPTLLARHPAEPQGNLASALDTRSLVQVSLPTRPRPPSMVRPFMPDVVSPSGHARSNAGVEAPRLSEPDTRPYIPWATRQQQAQAVRTGPVHGNPHLVPHVAPFVSEHKPGTIVVHVKEKRLYLIQSAATARVYPIGTAHGALDILGQTRVTTRRNMPTWTPTPNQRRRDPTLPRRVEAGPENPLGVRAIGLGWRYRLIHGTSDPSSIGHARSDGCIRMLNDDVVDLFRRVKVGNRVLVLASAASPLTEWRPAGYQEYKPRKRLKRRKWRKKRTRASRRYASRRLKRRR